MGPSYALLGRVRAFGIADALDGDNMLAVETSKGRQAGIDAGVVDLFSRGVILTDNDGAGSAATLAAASDIMMLDACSHEFAVR